MKIKSAHGVLYEAVAGKENEWQMLSAPEADDIARANGFYYAENIVKAFAGKEFTVDPETLKIKEVSEDFV